MEEEINKIERIKWDFEKKVKIPQFAKKYLWEYKATAPLEIIIKRVLQYGDFEEIQKLNNLYKEETYTIALKYPDIKRGVKFWIQRWKKSVN